METKSALRKKIKAKTAKLSKEERLSLSDRTLYLLEQDPLFINARAVAIYWSLEDEINTHRFIKKWSEKKAILLPVMDGANIYFATYNGMDDLMEEDRFGLMQPANSNVYKTDAIDLIVVPGVAFDRDNNRLGRGKGYYDRALSGSTCPKIGVCFTHQLVERLPVDIHDVKVDKVLYA